MQIAPISTSAPERAAPDPALVKAAQAFETLLLRQMIGAMRSAKLADDPLSSQAGETFRDMADARVAHSMAAQSAQRGTSIASLLLQQFEGKLPTPTPPLKGRGLSSLSPKGALNAASPQIDIA